LSASETGLVLLPLMLGIGFGSMLTGRSVSRTGLTAIFPSVGLIFATLSLLAFALFGDALGPRGLGLLLLWSGLSMGTVMGVVQVTVQNAAGPASLGSAAASVQLSRSIGAAVGTALVGTVLFAALALGEPEAARLFEALLQGGRAADIDALPSDRQAAVHAEIARAFRLAFLTVAGFAAAGLALAWSIPTRRL
jgi:hypothetical protein